MKPNSIYIGDALDLIDKLDLSPKLIIFSPPELSETNMTLVGYKRFLDTIYRKCYDKLDSGILCSISTDRKIGGHIYLKHVDIINAVGKEPNLYKIWCKSLKANLFILNFAHILIWKKNKRINPILPDVFVSPTDKIKGYKTKDTFSSEVVKILIESFTKKNQLVVDPFIGTGKVAKICLETGRKFIGFELKRNNIKLCKEFIRK